MDLGRVQFNDLCKCVLFIFLVTLTISSTSSGVETERENDEFNFDNLLSSLDSAVDTLFEYLGDADGCMFNCPSGEKPIRRPHHKPSSNGCGAAGMEIDTSFLPGVTKCCDKHDYCYDTCNELKEECDDQFQDCLRDICASLKKAFSENAVENCNTTASIMYAGVMTLGCKPYREAQQQACLCPPSKKKREL